MGLSADYIAAEDILGREQAIEGGLWGWRWTSIALKVGLAEAVSETLPTEQDEAEARHFAEGFRSMPGAAAFAERFSMSLVRSAVRTYLDCLPLLKRGRAIESGPIPEPLWSEIDAAMYTAEWAGEAAARAARGVYLGLNPEADQ